MLLALCAFFLGLQELAPPAQPAATALATFRGKEIGDRFGELLAAIGDVDGDGYSDIAIGAHCLRGETGPMAGSVSLLSGADGRPLHVFRGEGPFHRFGRAISSAAFFGGEGIDPVIGAPYFSKSDTQECGRVYIYSGGDGQIIRTFDGMNASDWFGYALACMDVNGDGFEDLLVGAPGFDGAGDPDKGGVYIYSGANGSLLRLLQGSKGGDWFGYALCCIDVDGDGLSDALVAAPGHDTLEHADTGRIYACSGADGRVLYTAGPGNPVDPVEGGNRFGIRLGVLNDLTGDGIQDFMACGFTGRGASTHVLDGASGTLLFSMEADGASPPQRPVCSIDDVDGDGTPDLAMGGGDSSTCFIDLLSGKDGRLLHRLPCKENHGAFGFALAGPLEKDLTGYARLLVAGNPYRNRGEDAPGVVGLYNLSPQGVLCRIEFPLPEPRNKASMDILRDGDGNGRSDLIVGLPFFDGDAGEKAGRISLYPDWGGKPSVVIEGASRDGRFGETVSALEDVDGDGRTDFIAAAPGFPADGEPDAGRVYIYSSAEGRLLDKTFTGAPGDRLGTSMAVLGDGTGDGIQDFLLGAPGHDGPDQPDIGQVLLVDGMTREIAARFEGSPDEGGLGAYIEPAGDLDGDGLEEFLCRAVCFAPEMDGLQEQVHVYSPRSMRPLYTIPALERGEQFGAAIQGIHDIDGDGIRDILVGAPDHTGSRGAGQGRIYFFSGKDGVALGVIDGEKGGDRFGRHIELVGDHDGDGSREIAVSAIAGGKGRVILFSSRRLVPIGLLEGEADTLNFGHAVTARDPDRGKGTLDLLAGAFSHPVEGSETRLILYAFGSGLPVHPDGELFEDPVYRLIRLKRKSAVFKEPQTVSQAPDPRLVFMRITPDDLPLHEAVQIFPHRHFTAQELDQRVLIIPPVLRGRELILRMLELTWRKTAQRIPSASGLFIHILSVIPIEGGDLVYECLP